MDEILQEWIEVDTINGKKEKVNIVIYFGGTSSLIS